MEPAAKRRKVQKICTLWVHDRNFSEHDVVFNIDAFPELELKSGALAKVSALGPAVAVRDFQQAPQTISKKTAKPVDLSSALEASPAEAKSRRERRSSFAVTVDESGGEVQGRRDADGQRAYVFVVQDASPEFKTKHAGLSVSVSAAVANVFGFRNRMQAVVAAADSGHWASHVELIFKDQYLARSDMWRMVSSELANKTVYKDQKLLFMGTVKATVKHVYRDGQKRKSGFFAPTTKPIFRSESARYVLFIQMSREMWDFDSQGSGEIMFNKVINGFLPDLFKKWKSSSARHLVTIVLFARIDYEQGSNEPAIKMQRSMATSQDFYRVVVSDMASGDWIKILHQLKKEFRTFLRDVSVNRTVSPDDFIDQENDKQPLVAVIAGKPCPAAQGNILEAINLASAQYSKDYIDRDLVRTGISIVVITAGTGVFEVDYSMLKLTTDTLVGSGIGMDLVSLSPMPLHSVPLFKYRSPQYTSKIKAGALSQSLMSASTITDTPHLSQKDDDDGWRYAMPHWIDISFWSGSTEDERLLDVDLQSNKRNGSRKSRIKSFNLRCRLYELQMMGVMENDMSNISIGLIHEHEQHPWHKLKNEITGQQITKVDRGYLKKLDRRWMDEHDECIFEDAHLKAAVGGIDASHTRPAAATDSSQEVHGDRVAANDGKSRSNYLDWRLQSSKGVLPLPSRRRDSSATITSTSGSVKSKTPTRLSRQISFGAGRFGPTKATAVAEVTLASTAEGPMFDKATHPARPGSSEARPDFAATFKANLGRPTVQRSPSQMSKAPEGADDSRSMPISISRNRADMNMPPDVVGSQDTVRDLNVASKAMASPSRSVTKDSGAILYIAGASQRGGPKQSLSSSNEAAMPIPKVLSPTSALAPWLVLVNPSNPKRNNFNSGSQFKRWQHVFPKPPKASTIKWKSLCSPASVPLTNEYLPSPEQMREEYHESFYEIAPANEDSLEDAEKARNTLVREMLSSRLSHGYQFVTGAAAAEWLGVEETQLSHIFEPSYVAKDGASALMSVGNTVHRITCTAGNQVAVRRFNRKSALGMESLNGRPFTLVYRPYVRTQLDKDYALSDITLKPPRLEYNWNTIDNFLAGHAIEAADSLRFWRARFVLIPVELPKGRRNMAIHAEDTAEELRLEGIHKLTQLWQRHRVTEDDQGLNLRNAKNRDANPLAIEFQTRDPSAVVAAGMETSLLSDQEGPQQISQLFYDEEPYESSNTDLQRLAHDLQSEKGIRMLDRRWHLRLHYNCFVGFDLTGWLLARFRDVETREEAVELGNKLMEKGLFQHVQKKHNFRDGQYFYQIASEFRLRPESKAGWFRTARSEQSVPATPSSEKHRNPMSSIRSSSRPSTHSSIDSGERTPTKEGEGKRRVELSRMMRYDLDPRKRSYRPEVIDLHYDRLHNPDNCYHIRIDWMNVTAKLVEDAIVSWATTVERYGLKLVEVPIGEARLITDSSPFRSPYYIQLAEPPPNAPAASQYFDVASFSPHPANDDFVYQRKLLQRLDFVLDVESATSFPGDVDVSYSWGRPDYKFTQFIHKSGVLLVQITDDGNFLLLANRLYNNRAATTRDVGKFDKSDAAHDVQSTRRNISTISHGLLKDRDKDPGRWSPFTSPLIRAAPTPDFRTAQHASPLDAGSAFHKTAEQLKESLEGCCSDITWLRSFYREALQPGASPSPRLAPVPDEKIPTLGLPPSIALRAMQSPVLQARASREGAISRSSMLTGLSDVNDNGASSPAVSNGG